MKRYLDMDSPLGTLRLYAEDEKLVRIDFGGNTEGEPGDSRCLHKARKQLDEYFAGRRTLFDLPLALNGTVFRKKVWNTLLSIPYGQTRSYAYIAREIGSAKATRAVGGANHHNPIPIIVPCHRVIGSDGELVGYGGGIEIKRYLLELERKYSQYSEHSLHTHAVPIQTLLIKN